MGWRYSKNLLYNFEVSFDFIDAGGVVYHPKYYILLERARYDFCRKLDLDLIQHFENGFVFVVAELEGRYRKPLKVAEKLAILTVVETMSARSLKVRQHVLDPEVADEALEIFDQPKKLERLSRFTGSLHLVHVDMKQMKSVPIPESFRQALSGLSNESGLKTLE